MAGVVVMSASDTSEEVISIVTSKLSVVARLSFRPRLTVSPSMPDSDTANSTEMSCNFRLSSSSLHAENPKVIRQADSK